MCTGVEYASLRGVGAAADQVMMHILNLSVLITQMNNVVVANR